MLVLALRIITSQSSCTLHVSVHSEVLMYIEYILMLPLVLNDQYFSPNIVRAIKSRRIRWAGHVAHMVEGRGVYRVFGGETRGKETNGETQA